MASYEISNLLHTGSEHVEAQELTYNIVMGTIAILERSLGGFQGLNVLSNIDPIVSRLMTNKFFIR
jgi:hypothetical protein